MDAENPEELAAGSAAADLADLIYERWLAAGCAGYTGDHAGIEALLVLAEALRNYASDPKANEAMMQAAVRVLVQLPARPPQGQFQAMLIAAMRRTSGPSERCEPETAAPSSGSLPQTGKIRPSG